MKNHLDALVVVQKGALESLSALLQAADLELAGGDTGRLLRAFVVELMLVLAATHRPRDLARVARLALALAELRVGARDALLMAHAALGRSLGRIAFAFGLAGARIALLARVVIRVVTREALHALLSYTKHKTKQFSGHAMYAEGCVGKIAPVSIGFWSCLQGSEPVRSPS